MIDSRLPIDSSTEQRIINIDGVVSVGEGLRDGQRVIVIGIDDPAARNHPEIPATLGGLPVVYESEQRPDFGGTVGRQGQPEVPIVPPGGMDLPVAVNQQHTQRVRPIPGGVSIGHVESTAGTSSFLATDGGTLYQLSNNHVLAAFGRASRGDEIVQPGPYDGGLPGADRAGTLADWVPVSQDEPVPVDVAWYEPDAEVSDLVQNVGHAQAEVVDPDIGDVLTMSSRTSGVHQATVDRVGVTIELASGFVFRDQIRIDRPLIPGDSGSPAVIQAGDGPRPAALGFAGTDSNGFLNYASNVEAASGLSILPLTNDGNGNEPVQSGFPPGMVWLAIVGLGTAMIERGND